MILQTNPHLQWLLLQFCRLIAIVALIMALKVWLNQAPSSSSPDPVNAVPVQLSASLLW